MDNELLVSLTGVIATLVVGYLGISLSRGREKKVSIYKPLSIGLPKDFKWLDVKIIKKSKDLKTAGCIQDNRSLRLDWDLLKRDEFITFLALPVDRRWQKDGCHD